MDEAPETAAASPAGIMGENSWPRLNKEMPKEVVDEMKSLHELYRSRRSVALSPDKTLDTRMEAARMANKYLKDAEQVGLLHFMGRGDLPQMCELKSGSCVDISFSLELR